MHHMTLARIDSQMAVRDRTGEVLALLRWDDYVRPAVPQPHLRLNVRGLEAPWPGEEQSGFVGHPARLAAATRRRPPARSRGSPGAPASASPRPANRARTASR